MQGYQKEEVSRLKIGDGLLSTCEVDRGACMRATSGRRADHTLPIA
jgi:hypothetical protein